MSKKFDVFVSYSRTDARWVAEELMPALQQVGAFTFIDDGGIRDTGEARIVQGLLPGDHLEKELKSVIERSRFILIVLTPEYFASKWCRLEQEEAMKQLDAGVSEGATVIQLILRHPSGRPMGLSSRGEGILGVDLSDVRERIGALSRLMQQIVPACHTPKLSLGETSLCHFLHQMDSRDILEGFTASHDAFEGKIELLLALKEVHDSIQVAQDKWNPFCERDGEKLSLESLADRARDLKDGCDKVLQATCSPFLREVSKRMIWREQLQQGIEELEKLLDAAEEGAAREKMMETRAMAQEVTKNVLFRSCAAIELNMLMRGAFEALPTERLAKSVRLLRELASLSWSEPVRERFAILIKQFDNLEFHLEDVRRLLKLHDGLQDIDHVIVGMGDLRANWEQVNLKWEQLQQICASVRWSKDLQRVAKRVTRSLEEGVEDEAEKEIVGRFRKSFHQGFSQTDVDLKHASKYVRLDSAGLRSALGELMSSSVT